MAPTMKLCWIGFILLIVVAGVIALIAARRIAVGLHVERMRTTIERELTEVLGLEVEIAGSIRIDLYPTVQLQIEGIRIANLPGRPSPHLLEVERTTLDLRVLPLLRGLFVINEIAFYDSHLFIEPDEQGSWSLDPHLEELDETRGSEEEGPITLVIRQLSIRNLAVYFDRHSEKDVRTLNLEELTVQSKNLASAVSITGRGTIEGGTFAIEAKTGSLEEFLNPTAPFPLDLVARLFDGRLEMTGTLGNPKTFRGMDLQFRVEAKNLAERARELGLESPPLGALSISGVLVDRDGLFGIEAFSARTKTDGEGSIQLDVEGSVRDIMRLEGVDLHMRVSIPDMDLFKSLTSLSLPGVPMQAEFEMDDEDGSLGVETKVVLARPGMFALTVEGAFGDLRRLKELDIRVGFETRTMGQLLGTTFDRPLWNLPNLGALEATAHLVIVDGHLGLEEIELRLGDPTLMQILLRGSVGALISLRDVELEAHVKAESASRAASLFGLEIPEIGNLVASLSLRDKDGSLGIENAILEVGSGDPFRLSLAGTFDDLRELEEIVFDAKVEARDLSLIGELAGVELPAVGPVAFAGTIRGSMENLTAHGELRLNRTVIDGEFTSTLSSSGRPTTSLRIRSPLIHIPDLLLAPSPVQSGLDRRRPDRFNLARWWRGGQALPLDQLRAFDAELRIEADRVTGYDLLDLRDFRILAKLDKGVLTLEDFGGEYKKGRISGRFEIDARPLTPTAFLELEVFNIDLTRAMSQFQEQTEYAGMLDFSIKLRTSGTTAHEVLSNLNGFFGAMLRDGAIVNEYSKAFTFDVLRVSIPSFFSTVQQEAPVHCLLALIPIEGGVAEFDTLYLEGERITITGEGQIDLPNNQLDLRLTPHLHDPGLVSVAATVEVTGSIENPKIRAKRRSMLASAANALYRNAIRPLQALDRSIRSDRRGSGRVIEDRCGEVARQRISQLETHEFETLDLEFMNYGD